MPISRGLRAACAGLLLPLLLAGPARARADAVPARPGGPQLGSAGIAVAPGSTKLPPTVASGWLVADLDTGDVLAAKNAHGRFAPASTLKALTALTLIPRLDPHRMVTPTFADVNAGGTRVGLLPHVAYPVSELFTAMLVVSGNDAADALATANGGLATTVAQMNAQAQRLQALDTHAATPDGLDAPGQLSSPYDLALIGRAAMQLPAFRTYVATKHSTIRGKGKATFVISSHDKLLYNYPGAVGIKNGYTVAAQATFIGAATRNGHTLIVTLMHTAPRYWPEAAALLDWGFAAEAAGVPAVGSLAGPAEPPAGAVAKRAAVTAAAEQHRSGSGLPYVPVGLIVTGLGAGIVVVRRRFA